jgi:hypothetical protein
MISPAVIKAIAELRECLQANGGDVQLIATARDGRALCAILGDGCEDQFLMIDPLHLVDENNVMH